MPNWTQNTLTAPKAVIDSIINGKGEVDFNLIVPTPETYPASKDESPDWYSWNCENWNTKWNAAYTRRETEEVVCFETALAMPYPVIVNLAKKAGVPIKIEWADEHDHHLIQHTLTVNPDGTEDYVKKDPSDDIKVGEEYCCLERQGGKDWEIHSITTLMEIPDGRLLVDVGHGKVEVMDRQQIAQWHNSSREEATKRLKELQAADEMLLADEVF